MPKGIPHRPLHAEWRYPPVGSGAAQRLRLQQAAARGARTAVGGAVRVLDADIFGRVPCFEGPNFGTGKSAVEDFSTADPRANVMAMAVGSGRKGGSMRPPIVANCVRKVKGVFDNSEIGQMSVDEEITAAHALFDRAGALLLEYEARHDAGILLRNVRAARVVAELSLGTDAPSFAAAIAASLLLEVDPAEVRSKVSGEVADIVEGAIRLSDFCYHPLMETSASSKSQLFKVILARIGAVPDMRCHVLAAVSAFAALQISVDDIPVLRSMADIQGHLAVSRDLANEAQYIHCEVLGRLGYGKLTSQLYDLAQMHLNYESYARFSQRVAVQTGLNFEGAERLLETTCHGLPAFFRSQGISARIVRRAKVIARIMDKFGRIYRRLVSGGMNIAEAEGRAWEDLSDLLGFRVICKTKAECYRLRDMVKERLISEGWEFVPEPEEDIDFIENPKDNEYQSLHLHFRRRMKGSGVTTLCVQIRTEDMEMVAEWGTASHWAAYKTALYEMDRVDFDRKLAKVEKTAEATRDMRWRELVDFARHYVSVYMLRGRSRPPAITVERPALSAYVHQFCCAGGPAAERGGVTVEQIYVGETGLLPRPLDVSLAILPAEEGFYQVYCLDPQTGRWFSFDGDRVIQNGAVVFVDTSRKAAVVAGHAARVNLPYSTASILAQALVADISPHKYSLRGYPSRPEQIGGAYEAFVAGIGWGIIEQALTDQMRINSEPGVPMVAASLTSIPNFDIAVRRAGFVSREVLGALFYMFSPAEKNTTVVDRIRKRYLEALRRVTVHCMILPRDDGRPGSEIFLLPEEDRPGVVRYFYDYLLKLGLGIEGVYTTTRRSRVVAQANRRVLDFVVDRTVQLEELMALSRLYEDIPEAPAGYSNPRGPLFEVSLRFAPGDPQKLSRIFGYFAGQGVGITKIDAPLMVHHGQPINITLTVRGKDKGTLAFVLGEGRARRKLTADLTGLGVSIVRVHDANG